MKTLQEIQSLEAMAGGIDHHTADSVGMNSQLTKKDFKEHWTVQPHDGPRRLDSADVKRIDPSIISGMHGIPSALH
jgi:hypothetical protein